MGPGPDIIGWIVNDCDVVCAGCVDATLLHTPVTFEAPIYDDGDWAHQTCDECHELLDEDVECCYREDCPHCGDYLATQEAIAILEQAQIELIADHATSVHVPGEKWRFDWDSSEHEQAEAFLDRSIDHLR